MCSCVGEKINVHHNLIFLWQHICANWQMNFLKGFLIGHGKLRHITTHILCSISSTFSFNTVLFYKNFPHLALSFSGSLPLSSSTEKNNFHHHSIVNAAQFCTIKVRTCMGGMGAGVCKSVHLEVWLQKFYTLIYTRIPVPVPYTVLEELIFS